MKNNKKAYSKLFKAALATSVAAGAMVAVAPFNTEAAGFKDLASTHAHYSSIVDLSDRGVIKGYTDGTFKPEASVTRGQASKIIALTLGLDTKNVVNPNFKDIKADNEYYGPIAALVAEGIVSGKADGTFAPGEKLTRSQMAKIITLAFRFEEGKLTDTKFKDVNATDWYNGYLQTLLDNEITTGTTPTTFSPYANVKRGQMASFVVRAEAAAKPVTVISVSDNSIETSTGKYTIAEDLKKVLNASNAAALKNAHIKFTEKDGQIVAVKSIEITADGTEAANIVLDGASSTIASDVKVNGDYVTLKNLTITGDLLIGKGVENSFLGDKIVVKGKTEVSDKSTGVSAAAVTVDSQITLFNSVLSGVVLARQNILLNLTGTGSVTSIIVDSNAIITAPSIIIPLVTVGTGVSELTLNAFINQFLVLSPLVGFNGIANIGSLEIINTNSRLTLGNNMRVGNLVAPVGAVASNLITNFNAVKGQITEIGGLKNPDATPPVVGGNTGGGSTGGNSGATPQQPGPPGGGNQPAVTEAKAEIAKVEAIYELPSGTYVDEDDKASAAILLVEEDVDTEKVTVEVAYDAENTKYVVTLTGKNDNSVQTKDITIRVASAPESITAIQMQARHANGTLAAGQPPQVNDGKFTVGNAVKTGNSYAIALTGIADLSEDANPVGESGKWMGVRLQLDGVTDINGVSYSTNGTTYEALTADESIALVARDNSFMFYMNGNNPTTKRYIKVGDEVIEINFTFDAYEAADLVL